MKEKRSYYAIIPANVRYDADLMQGAKLLYGEITALCNEKGYCWASDKYFADLYSVSKTTIQNWLKSLLDKGYITKEVVYKEGTKEILNRYIRIVVYPTQENLYTPIQENLRDNNTSFNNTTNNSTPRLSASLKEEFDKLWELYPKGKKQGKDKAFSAYKRAIKNGVTNETIAKGIKNYKKQIEYQRTELQFIKQGSTWFNQKCWDDEYVTGNYKPEKPAIDEYAETQRRLAEIYGNQ